jgi:hypothetical protein
MGLETYYGKTYYYRKHWNGGEVRSEYVASGDMALLMAAADRVEREERAEEAEAERSKLAELDAEEKQIADYLEGVDQAVSRALEAAGYHRPSRKLEWMKHRGPRNEEIHVSGRID